MLTTVAGTSYLSQSLHLPEWRAIVVAVVYGVLFYALLVWELNGPLEKAVRKYLSEEP